MAAIRTVQQGGACAEPNTDGQQPARENHEGDGKGLRSRDEQDDDWRHEADQREEPEPARLAPVRFAPFPALLYDRLVQRVFDHDSSWHAREDGELLRWGA